MHSLGSRGSASVLTSPLFLRCSHTFSKLHTRPGSSLKPNFRKPRPWLNSTPSTLSYHKSAPQAYSLPSQASSAWTVTLLAALVISGIAVKTTVFPKVDSPVELRSKPVVKQAFSQDFGGEVDTFNMSSEEIPTGHVGNLTEEQEAKLREMWTLLLRIFGVKFESEEAAATEAPAEENAPLEKKKSRLGFLGSFRSGNGDNGKKGDGSVNAATSDLSNLQIADGDDKFGQTKEFQQALADQSPEELRESFWSLVKQDNPDALVLRFLRARKWDVGKAVVMLISTLRWRTKDMHVDDDIMLGGEAKALEQSQSSDPATRKAGEDFMAQLRMGKSFIHGYDKFGRPISIIRVRLHKIGAQSEKSMERFTVHMIETTRCMLPQPVETAVIVFDMTNFTLSNMDYVPVKFIIKCFEANYPESLGAVLIHKAPWIFSSIWKIIKGWLDPVVAAKVHFTNSVEDLEAFSPRDRIIKELEGDEDWEFKYVEPDPHENDLMKDTTKRDEILAGRKETFKELQDNTRDWIKAASKGDQESVAELKKQREQLVQRSNQSYWELDPYVRSRSVYDRTGVLLPGGKVNFYDHPKEKSDATESQTEPPNTELAKEEKAGEELPASGNDVEKKAEAESDAAKQNEVEVNENTVAAS